MTVKLDEIDIGRNCLSMIKTGEDKNIWWQWCWMKMSLDESTVWTTVTLEEIIIGWVWHLMTTTIDDNSIWWQQHSMTTRSEDIWWQQHLMSTTIDNNKVWRQWHWMTVKLDEIDIKRNCHLMIKTGEDKVIWWQCC